MPDVVVTVPKTFRWPGSTRRGLGAWIDEGDPAGSPWSGQLWVFSTWGGRPKIAPRERVYVVCQGRLRGYAPLVDMRFWGKPGLFGAVELVRGGGAVAVTIPEAVQGFQGWRYRWWDRTAEIPSPEWQTAEG